jgi:hypothetical protein
MPGRSTPRREDVLAEIDALCDSLGRLVARPPPSAPAEGEVWLLYARTETAVARLKYRLGAERPGVFSELPRSKNPEEFLSRALHDLEDARALARSASLAEALTALRAARTGLRAYLAELGRVRAREKRKAALSRRSSLSSS